MDYETWYHAYFDNGMYHGPKYSGYVQLDENGDLWEYHTKWGSVEDWTPAQIGPELSSGYFSLPKDPSIPSIPLHPSLQF